MFDREFGDALSIAARDIIITIECKAGFTPKRVLGRDGEISGNRITLKLNQLQAENERYVVVELDPPSSGIAGSEADIASIERRLHEHGERLARLASRRASRRASPTTRRTRRRASTRAS